MELTKSQLGSGTDIDAFVVYFLYWELYQSGRKDPDTDIRCVNNADTDEAFKVKKGIKLRGGYKILGYKG